MTDAHYQSVVINDIEQKIGEGKTQRLDGFEKNVVKIDDKFIVLIKYSSNQKSPSFQFTDKEVNDLTAIEKEFPLRTFVVFTTGAKFSFSLSLKELKEISRIFLNQKTIIVEDITLSSFFARGQFGEKRINKNEYLNFL